MLLSGVPLNLFGSLGSPKASRSACPNFERRFRAAFTSLMLALGFILPLRQIIPFVEGTRDAISLSRFLIALWKALSEFVASQRDLLFKNLFQSSIEFRVPLLILS
jgi:hypothetical protein